MDEENIPVQARASLGLNGLSLAPSKVGLYRDLLVSLRSDEPLSSSFRTELANAIERGLDQSRGVRLSLGAPRGYWDSKSKAATIRRALRAWRFIEDHTRSQTANFPNKSESQAAAIRALDAQYPNWQQGDPKNYKHYWEKFKAEAGRSIVSLAGPKTIEFHSLEEITSDEKLFDFAIRVFAKRMVERL